MLVMPCQCCPLPCDYFCQFKSIMGCTFLNTICKMGQPSPTGVASLAMPLTFWIVVSSPPSLTSSSKVHFTHLMRVYILSFQDYYYDTSASWSAYYNQVQLGMDVQTGCQPYIWMNEPKRDNDNDDVPSRRTNMHSRI